MDKKLREKIVKKCKENEDWYKGESFQDKLIESECIKLNYTLVDFYAEDGKYLNKLLNK